VKRTPGERKKTQSAACRNRKGSPTRRQTTCEKKKATPATGETLRIQKTRMEQPKKPIDSKNSEKKGGYSCQGKKEAPRALGERGFWQKGKRRPRNVRSKKPYRAEKKKKTQENKKKKKTAKIKKRNFHSAIRRGSGR